MKNSATVMVEEFAESIIKQRKAIHSGTTKEVKQCGKKRESIAKQLLSMGDDAKSQFARLFHHPDREVRAIAAVYLITSMPDEALAVFEDVAQGDDLIAMGAQMRIREWEEHPENYDESNWV